jgi:[lysine-biosynthesis-protein LysW]--L-2-aminoadipate ligase
LDDDAKSLLKSVHGIIGGEFLAADLFNVGGKWLVNEVNDGGEFRNSIEPTGTDIPGAIVRAAWETRQS